MMTHGSGARDAKTLVLLKDIYRSASNRPPWKRFFGFPFDVFTIYVLLISLNWKLFWIS